MRFSSYYVFEICWGAFAATAHLDAERLHFKCAAAAWGSGPF